MSTGRSIRRKKEKALKKKAKKAAKSKMAQAQEAIRSLPPRCSYCSAVFDRTIPENLDTWHVAVTETAIRLTCPKCLNQPQENQ